MNLAELVVRHADESPGRCALSFAGREITYGDYKDFAGRLASVLLKHGVQRGDRVLFFSRNSPEFFITYTACAWIGAVFTPVHHAFKGSELRYVGSNSRARLAIVGADLLEVYLQFAENLETLPREVISVGESAAHSGDERVQVFGELLAQESELPEIVAVEDAAPVLICYTSGSTSRPKPVLRSHAGEIWNAETYRKFWDLRPEDRALMSLPLSWVYGLSTLGQSLLAAGSTIEILTHFNPVTVVETISEKKITLFGGTNTMYVKMLDVFDKRGADLSSLRNCYIGGEPSNATAVERFEGLIGSRLWQGYAATEAAPVLLTDPCFDKNAPRHTVGRLVPGAEIRLVSADLEDVSAGEPGEAWLRCPGSMLGYFDEPELTSTRITEDGWFRSGDLVVEKNGYYFVVGRKIDMIIRGGSNIAPSEVEGALTAIPGIVDAVVFGIPDSEYGEKVVAALKTTAGFDLSDSDISSELSQDLASYKIPTTYLWNLDLPDGVTGKRDRRAVREVAIAVLGTENGGDSGDESDSSFSRKAAMS